MVGDQSKVLVRVQMVHSVLPSLFSISFFSSSQADKISTCRYRHLQQALPDMLSTSYNHIAVSQQPSVTKRSDTGLSILSSTLSTTGKG